MLIYPDMCPEAQTVFGVCVTKIDCPVNVYFDVIDGKAVNVIQVNHRNFDRVKEALDGKTPSKCKAAQIIGDLFGPAAFRGEVLSKVGLLPNSMIRVEEYTEIG